VLNISPFVRVVDSDPMRVVASHEDITALKLAEEALRKREQDRDRLRHSLELAREVQQRLLPQENPIVAGLDIAGRSIYRDETGVDPHAHYEENDRGHFSAGSIIVFGTDGIWESRNSSGEMLGKSVINDIIRQNASRSAAEIMEAVITKIRKFQASKDKQQAISKFKAPMVQTSFRLSQDDSFGLSSGRMKHIRDSRIDLILTSATLSVRLRNAKPNNGRF
jgi:hypothetical protein